VDAQAADRQCAVAAERQCAVAAVADLALMQAVPMVAGRGLAQAMQHRAAVGKPVAAAVVDMPAAADNPAAVVAGKPVAAAVVDMPAVVVDIKAAADTTSNL
jgi:tetrahydromethanopterin S-methyltransferase subunit H